MRSSLKRRHLAAVSVLAMASLVVAPSSPALAATTPPEPVTINVDVGSGITLTLNSTSFTLGGVPGASVEKLAAVGLTVRTNNPTGYSVTVAPTNATLDGPLGGTIQVSAVQ